MIAITQKDLDEMINHVKQEYPNEACGILAGKNQKVEKIYKITNVDQSPLTYFMDPQELFKTMKEIRQTNREMLGIYHSHAEAPPYPSSRDVGLAFYPDAVYFIISLKNFGSPETKAYWITEGKIKEAAIKILKEN